MQKLRFVRYKGKVLRLPSWVKFLVVTASGSIQGWNIRPSVQWRDEEWAGDHCLARVEEFGKLTQAEDIQNWKSSLELISNLPILGTTTITEIPSTSKKEDSVGLPSATARANQFLTLGTLITIVATIGAIANIIGSFN